eukprot:scaffold8818_cov129-Isochrysis_galbana.AAC.5
MSLRYHPDKARRLPRFHRTTLSPPHTPGIHTDTGSRRPLSQALFFVPRVRSGRSPAFLARLHLNLLSCRSTRPRPSIAGTR